MIDDERAAEWDKALRAWLDSRKAPRTRESYELTMRLFREFVKLPLYDVSPNEVIAWKLDMEHRGLASSTICLRMSGVSSFYDYAMQKYWVRGEDGRFGPLSDRNPIRAVDRPQITPYLKATYFTAEQVEQLLGAIPRDTVQGLRDYALFLTYILTGRRNKAIRSMRWGDIREHLGRMQFYWKNKNKERWDDLPDPAWQAIRTYLYEAGRLGKMRQGDYIFCPLTDRATRLPTVDAENWDRNQPLSGKEVGALLKKYAKHADLGLERVHVHMLRHTAAELYRKAGLDIFSVSKLLAHSDVHNTQRYFDHMDGHENTAWREVAELVGVG